MSVIEKMMQNANIEKHWNSTPYGGVEEYYPPFTAEKQIDLIKWLGKLDGKLEITCTYNKEKFIFNFYFNRKTDKNPDPKYPYSNFLNADIEILIASIINDIWQDLTEEEKEALRGILRA